MSENEIKEYNSDIREFVRDELHFIAVFLKNKWGIKVGEARRLIREILSVAV